MKRYFLLLLFLAVISKGSAQSYCFDSIPENLKRGANAVVRSEQCLLTILKPGNAVLHVKKVATLLNENSRSMRSIAVPYDKSSKVNFLRGLIYDQEGEIIKTLGILDVQDVSAVTGEQFYTDDRLKILYFPVHKYPFTVEYEYEIGFTSLIGYPRWEFQDSPGVAVEKSGIQVVVPSGMSFRSLAEGLLNPVDSVIEKDIRIYTWQEENIPAQSRLKYDYRASYVPPTLHIAPEDFVYGGISGSMNSWKSYGEWYYNLIKGRDVIPEDLKQQVLKLVSGIQDDRRKTEIIYKYMQSGTRYVLIDIGIGGMQPALASNVAKTGFGDCKALVNYTKGLLSAAGISSYPALIRAGEGSPVSGKFVDQLFNHMILCVPMKTDTIWLECTDQSLPFNYLGTFTDDRYALLITGQGGKLVRTPAFRKGENTIRRTGTASLNNFGKSSLKLSCTFSGSYFSDATKRFRSSSEDEMKIYLSENLRFSDINTSSVNYEESGSEQPTAKLNYETTINDFSNLTGKMMTFNPTIDMQDYIVDVPASLEVERYLAFSDSVTYNLPVGYKVDFRPSDEDITNDFGRFSYKIVTVNDRLIYRRYIELNKALIPLNRFEDFRKFINTMAGKDREVVILKKS